MTTPQQYERLYRLFESACGLEPSQRSALLDRECAGDPTMRRQVEDLLAWDRDPTSFLESTPLGGDTGLTDVDQRDPGAAERQCGQRIDHYLIREILGEGGIAVVYLAEQEKPVRRRVALKMIKPGMDSRQVIARFEAERQALAMMDHACVAKVFDAGSTEAGRPYFVMEHVPGVPITEHCDRQRLSIDDRLKLFMQVCEGVQHAHQKGIIHRDLKPSNVLVEIKDGQAVPKVIDFGVAKALHQRLTERTVFTEQGQLIGTPAYMSPEQAEMTAQDIDTRSDIYSLGVLLYELLTGGPPFDPRTLRQVGFGEIQRIIREEEPAKPSTQVSSNGRESTTYAQLCRAEPRTLIRELRGDLDWIVMKALEKDRTRRYDTAHDLALDIQRHLEHEPVHASPPSRAYRLRKFVRRHRTGVAAGVAVAASLIVAAGVSMGFAVSEAKQRRVASAERDTARAVIGFLNDDLLGAVAPSAEAGRGRDVLMREVLDEAAKRIEEASSEGGRFEDKPLVEASIRQTLGETYEALGEYWVAEPHVERARELRRQVLGEEHQETLRSMAALAGLYNLQGRGDEGDSLHLQTFTISERALGEEHPDTLRYMCNVASCYRNLGRFDKAEQLYLKALEIQNRVLPAEHPDTLLTMGSLGIMYELQGRYDEAEQLLVQTLEIQERVTEEAHRFTFSTLIFNLANVYFYQGRYDEAETLCLEVLEISTRILGEAHPRTLTCMNNLAYLYAHQGRSEQAESLARRALEISVDLYGQEHPESLRILDTYGFALLKAGRVEEAEALFSGLVATITSQHPLGEGPTDTIAHHGMCLVELGRLEEAELLLLEAYPTLRPLPNPDTKATIGSLIKLYEARDEPTEAAKWRAELLPAEQQTVAID